MATPNPASAPLPQATIPPSRLKQILTALDIAAGALVAGNSMIGMPSQVVQALGGLCLVLTYLGYGDTKAQLARLSEAATVALIAGGAIVATSSVMSACGAAQRAAELQALEACGRSDAPGLLGDIGSAASQATSAADFGSRLESSALGALTSDVIGCLTDIWIASQTAGTTPNSAVKATLEPDAVALVKQWRATYDTPAKIDAWRAKVRSGQR